MVSLAPSRRDLYAYALLSPLIATVAYLAMTVLWHSNASNVDTRTYLEMIEGVARNGLPYMPNGAVDRFPEMQAQWHYFHGGKLWGIYPPVFPYLAQPAYHWGGVRGVIRFNIAMTIPYALGVFALARRYLANSYLSVAAVYLVVLGAPVWTNAHDTSSYTPAMTAVVWMMYFALASLDARGTSTQRYALFAGVLGGLSIGLHLFVVPSVVLTGFLLACLPVADQRAVFAPEFVSPQYLRWFPTRGSFSRGASMLAGAAVPLVPVAIFNHVRFDTWNPVTYGPCVWRSCIENGMINQTPSQMLEFIGPTLAYFAVAGLAYWLVRRSKTARWTVVLVAFLLLTPESSLHQHTFLFFAVVAGYTLDVSWIPLGQPYWRALDKVGNLFGSFVLKSTVQGTPILLLSTLARGGAISGARATALLAIPSAATYATLALRANMPIESAVGLSFMHFRYAMPVIPMLIVLALSAVSAFPWKKIHVALGLVLTVSLYLWITHWPDDLDPLRRIFLLRGTLAIAFVAFLSVALIRIHRDTVRKVPMQLAMAATLLAGATAIAVNMGVDLRLIFRDRALQDARLDAVARQTPERFALIGWALEMNQVLALRATRDLEYADLYEATGWGNFHAIVEQWTHENRPIFGVFQLPLRLQSPFQDIRFETVDQAQGLVRIVMIRRPN